jgi:hypothetical protein
MHSLAALVTLSLTDARATTPHTGVLQEEARPSVQAACGGIHTHLCTTDTAWHSPYVRVEVSQAALCH